MSNPFSRASRQSGIFMESLLDTRRRLPQPVQVLRRWVGRGSTVGNAMDRFNNVMLELHVSYRVVCSLLSLVVCAPVAVLPAMEVVTVTGTLRDWGLVSQKTIDRAVPEHWAWSTLGQLALFAVWVEVSNVFRIPFFLHVLAPAWRRMGWYRVASRAEPSSRTLAAEAAKRKKWRASNERKRK